MSAHETSTDYRHPYRPRAVKLANRLLAPLGERQLLSFGLQPAALMAAAERRTRLHDFGEPTFREALERLCDAVNNEARLHAVGRLITRLRLTTSLATRLRLEALLRREPAILEQPLSRPIVIVGLPRTGTTMLHRLLASDRARIRTLTTWEALSPVPDGADDPRGRIASAERSEAALKYLAPDFFAVHPIDAGGPEEEILLLDLAFRSTVAEANMHVPSYASWLEEADQAPAYRTLARALKALSWQRLPREREWRWVLKTPHHLEWLEELPRVLDDPLIVWTHRSPREVVGSFCSMIAHGRGVFSDHVDPARIGAAWLRKGQRMVERAMAARPRIGEANFIDVAYKDLMRDPIAVARMIEERAGLGWNAEAEERMKSGMGREKKDRHGVHRYSLEAFGLTEADVDAAFARYTASHL